MRNQPHNLPTLTQIILRLPSPYPLPIPIILLHTHLLYLLQDRLYKEWILVHKYAIQHHPQTKHITLFVLD